MSLAVKDSLSYLLGTPDEYRGKLTVKKKNREVVSLAVPVVTPVDLLRTARKSITCIACLSCHAAMNLKMGIGKGSTPGTTSNLGKRNTRHKYQTI